MNIIPFKGQNKSGTYNLNFLCRTGRTYIMDNHLAAGWCWAQQLDFSKQYNLFHIDRHYDLLDGQIPVWVNEIKRAAFNHQTSSISDLLNLQTCLPGMPNQAIQLFRWDNYITIFNNFYPDIWNAMSFATKKDGTIPLGWQLHEPCDHELLANLADWLSPDTKVKSVLNLDVDYFFTSWKKQYVQLHSDEFIRALAQEIHKSWDDIEVFTLCLSPDCCGGWDNAIKVAKIITEELRIDWEIK